jgi:hypothetical protein
MVTTTVIATPDIARATAAISAGQQGIALYEIGRPALPGVGHTLPHTVLGLPQPPTLRAWDFLSIALAVFAADRFVLRGDAADGWTRILNLSVDVVDPAPWTARAERFAAALRFLTGDIWSLSFNAGGKTAPSFQGRLTDRDCACLFSGGLDSLIGAISLLEQGARPLLVSQASQKEGPYQAYLAGRIGLSDHRFAGKAIERGPEEYEQSSRARSILFFAYGVIAAAGIGGRLIVPENGLISINPPLTNRRVGSLSTRTTHPYFVSELQGVLDGAAVGVTIRNPCGLMTKGEMLAACPGDKIAKLASESYSCGKGKRKNQQCGRCVPCLIRRAAFLKARIPDQTAYQVMDLATDAKNDDVQAARIATAQLQSRNIDRWAAEAGPLPSDPTERAKYVDVIRRGLVELGDLLATVTWP